MAQNETISVNSKWGSYTSMSFQYKMRDLHFIKKVKQYIIKHKLYEPYSDFKKEKVAYFDYGKSIKPKDHFDKVVNIDITAAYWETAYQKGLLSKEIYDQGMSFDYALLEGKAREQILADIKSGLDITTVLKKVRLAAIGSLAKKVKVYSFDGKKQTLVDTIRQEHTEILWDVITVHVGKVLQEAARACGKDFIFFWVDGIYIKKSSSNAVKAVFKKHGYKFKVNPIKSIDVTEKNIYVNLPKPELHRIVDGKEIMKDKKPFPFRQK